MISFDYCRKLVDSLQELYDAMSESELTRL
jgi:hypothetical protein